MILMQKNSPKYFKAIFPGKYIQGEKALNELPELVALFGSKALLLTSKSIINSQFKDYPFIESANWLRIEKFNGECCESELQRISKILESEEINVLIGMGGGKVIDAAKIASDRKGIPVIIVPTIASTDAPCSACAVIYSESGVFESVYYQKSNPEAVLVDTSIISKAPVRFLVAGMGDALATWFEADSCSRTNSPNECGGLSTMAALNLARLCYDTLLKYGKEAKVANEKQVLSPALNNIIEANILLSGLGFESSGLAAAHSIHNGLTALTETHQFYHGEKVAFGVLTGLHLNNAKLDVMEEVYSFCREVGLPTTFADLGINKINHEKLRKVAEKACAPNEGIHHEAMEVTPEIVLEAMILADAYGKN